VMSGRERRADSPVDWPWAGTGKTTAAASVNVANHKVRNVLSMSLLASFAKNEVNAERYSNGDA
jgi:hypothetical protein